MTELLYLKDSYLKEFEATVVKVDGNRLYLDKTIFYPRGGGQPSDRGVVTIGARSYEVQEVVKDGDDVAHILAEDAEGVGEGAAVKGVIDWPLRYAHMRYHTALHIISGAAYRLYKEEAKITGSQIYSDRARMDLALEGLNREKIDAIINLSNEVVNEGREVVYRFVTREEAMQMSDLIRVKPELIPSIPILRIVEIKDFDAQLDGGTHVRNTREVGQITVTKIENKGKKNRRIEIRLEE
ncbi:MAG TPA: alanyl-tRNA editing protein [Candidatus Caldiarchaeum subterraneum]|uniref:Alanyl-tRNA editing protein n=1 Tax=Caldiarchaeum subterraneum TaxID=311458 RepID=A0A832ZWZ1_CALS0|nr:alanyl-tRNA editing protein [Candidatus Caldarchaeum subterraneum]